MPSIGHIVYGLCFLIPIMYYAKDENRSFNYKVAFIFLANNYLGPDAAQVWVGLPFHSLLGFLIFALPLALFYSYFSRFSMVKSEGKFPLKYVDEGIREVNLKNAYCLVVAGGICHFFIDMFYHKSVSLSLWPGVTIPHTFMLTWGGAAYHVVDPRMLISYIIILIAILLSLYTFMKGYKETFKLLMIITGLTILIVFTIGVESFGGERDIAVIFHSFLFVFAPLFLLMYAAKDVQMNPNETPDKPKIERALLLKIVAIFSMIFALVWVIIALIGIITPHVIANPLASALNADPKATAFSIVILGILILILAGIILIGSIGLLFKINACRYMVIGSYSILFILAFPFAISLFLCEEDVKEMFTNKTT